MKITALKTQVKNPERVSVFVDNKYSFSVTINEVLELKLTKDLQIEHQQLESFKKVSADGKIKARTLEWLLVRPRSVQELKEYFYRKKVEPDLQAILIDYFMQNNIVNDTAYTEWAVERLVRKNKSRKEIASALRNRGITAKTAEEVLKEHGVHDSTALQSVLQKVGQKPRYKDPQKLTAYLLSKGFSYHEIKAVLNFQELEQDA